MADPLNFEFNAGLSEEEKHDLEEMIIDFQKQRSLEVPPNDMAALRQQIDTINNRLEYLTNTLLTLDRRIKPLYETIRLTHQKTEILNHRINSLIKSIRTGDRL